MMGMISRLVALKLSDSALAVVMDCVRQTCGDACARAHVSIFKLQAQPLR
jgi:hypothetical protein